MQLGFVSAILGDMSFEELLAFAADEGFSCVEIMCWPPGGAERRYAGVCHLDVNGFDAARAHHVRELVKIHGVSIAGLGYYPNPLDPNPDHRSTVGEHLVKVIDAAGKLGIGVVNTFIGRDWNRSTDDNWPLVRQIWPALMQRAKSANVRLAIEHCPMLFSNDEWPGGKNLPVSPELWKLMIAELPGIGLNFDPSHLVWQFIDIPRAIREFAKDIAFVHAKDERIDRDKLHQVGILGLGWHVPKLPGLGEVDWGAFFAALTDARYMGPVCIEVEDRAYEGSQADRRRALRQSKRYLEQFIG